jgi:hypothetical protein
MTKPKIYKPGEKRQLEESEDSHYIPDGIDNDYLGMLFANFVEDHLYDTKSFLKHFGERRAIITLPVPSLLDLVKNSVCYDEQNRFDCRILVMFVSPVDRPLLIDVIKNVSERFVNNPNTPKSPLTLAQFKVLLAYRMTQLSF